MRVDRKCDLAGVRVIAHQLNNTLVPLLTLSSLLADALHDAETTRDLQQLVASAKRARDLVKLLFAEANRLDRLMDPGLPASASPLGAGAPS
jgi:hypothetical protein